MASRVEALGQFGLQWGSGACMDPVPQTTASLVPGETRAYDDRFPRSPHVPTDHEGMVCTT